MGKRAKLVGLPVVSFAAIHASIESQRAVESTGSTQSKLEQTGTPPTIAADSLAPAKVTNRPWVAPRHDAPVCNYSRKARRLDLGHWTPAFKAEALQALRRDYTASSAQGPNASVLRTWESMHHRMMGHGIPVYPLTVDKITQVAAAFKICGYRSFSNYLSKAKERHVQMYGEWPADLALEAKRATRSVTRGIGPVCQRQPLEIERIMDNHRDHQPSFHPVVNEGPICPHTLMIIGTFFMLREIEASLLLAANVRTDDATQQVTLRLPSSKTDPSASNTERSWGCLCAVHGSNNCPYHLAKVQLVTLFKLFGALTLRPDLPFFPTINGTTVEKIRVVDTFEHIHTRLGIRCHDEDGMRHLGGHSMRLAGARLLSASGMHLYQVELMARWKSPMLIHYAQTAPLAKITQVYENARSNADTSRLLDEVRAQMEALSKAEPVKNSDMTQFESRVTAVEQKLNGMDAQTRNMIQSEITKVRHEVLTSPSEFVMNLSSKTWHKVCMDGLAISPTQWTTKCGWRFGMSKFIRRVDPPSNGCKKCDKCWDIDNDSSSSSDSSESDD